MSLWKSKETILQNFVRDIPCCPNRPVICHMLVMTIHWFGKLTHPDLPGLIRTLTRTLTCNLKGRGRLPKAQDLHVGEGSP